MKHILSVCILPLLMLTLQHCDEDSPKPKTELEKLPPPTQSGKRTFGCLVDGKAWVIEMPTHVQAYYQTGTLGISAGVINNSFNSNLSFYLVDLDLSEMTYQLGQEIAGLYGRYFDHRSVCGYLTNLEYIGAVTITHLDKVNFIISGTFEFEAYSEDCTKAVKVTDGRFDIHYAV